MAGYFQKLNGYVYSGENKAGEALTNGLFVTITSTGVKKLTAAGDIVMRVAEKTTLFGLPAVRLEVVEEGKSGIYMVENEWDINDASAYDESLYACASGDYVKMRMPVQNDQMIISVTAEVLATLSVNDLAKPASGGSIAKYVPQESVGGGGSGSSGD